MTYQENIIKNIKEYIAKNNMQQKDFAKLVNCSESTMSRYLSKTRNISLDFVIQASKVTNINLERLVEKNNLSKIDKAEAILTDVDDLLKESNDISSVNNKNNEKQL